MKRIKLSLICTAALMLALSFAGCTKGENVKTRQRDVEQTIETEITDDDKCPDGQCPEDGKCPDGQCPEDGKCPEDDKCPDGKCPRGKRPHWKIGGGRHRAEPLPCPHKGK